MPVTTAFEGRREAGRRRTGIAVTRKRSRRCEPTPWPIGRECRSRDRLTARRFRRIPRLADRDGTTTLNGNRGHAKIGCDQDKCLTAIGCLCLEAGPTRSTANFNRGNSGHAKESSKSLGRNCGHANGSGASKGRVPISMFTRSWRETRSREPAEGKVQEVAASGIAVTRSAAAGRPTR